MVWDDHSLKLSASSSQHCRGNVSQINMSQVLCQTVICHKNMSQGNMTQGNMSQSEIMIKHVIITFERNKKLFFFLVLELLSFKKYAQNFYH